MKCLLDTHTFLWTISESSKLSKKVLETIKNPKNEIFVSAVSFWEISIKFRIKKLNLDTIEPEDLLKLAEKMDFQVIGLSAEEAISYHKLNEDSHNDPFDRMLIWQCISRNMMFPARPSFRFLPKLDGITYHWSPGKFSPDPGCA